jgi:hypothetical protein
MELAAGITAVVGLVYFLATGSTLIIFFAAIIASASLAALFFGQRIAKDYPGAAVIVPYFLLMLFLMWLTDPLR